MQNITCYASEMPKMLSIFKICFPCVLLDWNYWWTETEVKNLGDQENENFEKQLTNVANLVILVKVNISAS